MGKQSHYQNPFFLAAPPSRIKLTSHLAHEHEAPALAGAPEPALPFVVAGAPSAREEAGAETLRPPALVTPVGFLSTTSWIGHQKRAGGSSRELRGGREEK